MTDNDMDIEKRMERIEKDIAEIKAALLGNVIEGTPGMLGRLRDREQTAEQHDIRILSLEREANHHVDQKEFDELEDRVKQNTQWRKDIQAQWRLLMAVGGGNLIGLIYLIYRIVQLSGQVSP